MPECKADLYYSDKLSGLSIAEIARKHGVSHQAVSQAISNKYGKRRTPRFQKWTEEKCIYGNLRKWLNDNEIGITKFLIMFCKDDSYSPGNATNLYDWFSGKRNPSKSSIDRLLQITGMSYEQLFSIKETSCTPVGDDLISRSALWLEVMMLPHNGDMISSDEVEGLIMSEHAVDAEPAVYANWVDRYGGKFANPRYDCSACGQPALYAYSLDELRTEIFTQKLSERCPNCGAHMDEEVADG